jgi:hypothetical protein
MIIQGISGVGVSGTPVRSIAIPSHRPGDMIILIIHAISFNEGKPTASGTVPNWVRWAEASDFTGPSGHTLGVFYFVATASNHTSGTWGTGTSYMNCMVLRPTGSALSIGAGEAVPLAAQTYIQFPALTLQAVDGTSWGFRAALRPVAGKTASMATPPPGWTNQLVNPPSPDCMQCIHARPNITENPVLDTVNMPTAAQISVGSTFEIKEAGPFLTSVPLMAIA